MGIDGHETWGFSVVALCAAVLIGGAFGHAPPCADGRLSNTVRWMGRHSYELYLFHIIVLAGIRNLVPKGTMSYEYKLPSLTLFMGASALLAAGVARHFSNPINLHLRHLALRLTRPLRRSSPAA
jgi:peptidoglycan/LPS O-acetylase OafA/YrhL